MPQDTPLAQAGNMHQKAGDWFIQPARKVNGTTYARIYIDNTPARLERLPTVLTLNVSSSRPAL